MNCDEILNLLGPLHDGELPSHEASAVKTHLQNCASCRNELQEIVTLSKSLQQAGRYDPPAALTATIASQIEEHGSGGRAFGRRWIKPALSHMAAVFAGGVIVFSALQFSWDRSVSHREVVTAHVRSLMFDNLTQVTSGNPHKVKPWFSGKLNFSPVFKDLDAHGYPLEGGRIDYLQDNTVAVLVYKRREHRINLFVLPAQDSPNSAPVSQSRNGYNVVNWTNAHFSYWAVSDLNKSELLQFMKLASE